jgi:hypothetical protein
MPWVYGREHRSTSHVSTVPTRSIELPSPLLYVPIADVLNVDGDGSSLHVCGRLHV